MCQQTAEYLVPCSTQSQFPYLWSAALHCTHGMAILGDPGADEMGVPSRSCNPRERNWEPLPITPVSRPRPAPPGLAPPLPRYRRVPSRSGDPGSTTGTDPHPKPSESRPPQPGFTQSLVRSRRVFSLSVHLGEHNWEARPQPRQKPTPAPRRPRSPRPCTVQVPSQLLAFTPG